MLKRTRLAIGLSIAIATIGAALPVGAADNPKKPEGGKPGEDKPFEAVIKDMNPIPGLFTVYRNPRDNQTLIEILPSQMDSVFLFAGSIDRAVGERGLYGAQMGADFPFVFHRIGKSIEWIQKNTSFTAESGTPEARATARSFPDAILGSAKILSAPHPERHSLLIDASELFATRDLPGIAPGLSRAYRPSSYQFDRAHSALTGVKGFPENVLFEVMLHYKTENPRSASIALADARSVPVTVKYELSVLKPDDYRPRLADDRVGHFLTIHEDFTSDHPRSPYVRYINRWNLEKADPNAPLSPPKKPIVFWLENTIPLEYREPIRQGILMWNKAFERIGFQDAIQVKQQPDSADWDPADTRYNTIRWFAGVDATFAIGPSRANPYTGEIYDADISISEGLIRYARRLGEEVVSPLSEESETWIPTAWNRGARLQCDYAAGLAEQAAFGLSVLEARGGLSPAVEEKLMDQFVTEVTAHEVGHTLGLRHNFRGTTMLRPDELNDVQKTHELGQSASVMDYNPIIIAAKGETQGDFVPTTLGPYDYWAIEYAYEPIQGDERAELAKIAARAGTDSLLPYSTDEDALGTYSARSIDPLANQYDQSDDPLAYFQERVRLDEELWSSMEDKLAEPGEGYQVMRRAMARGLSDYNRSLLTSSKFIGGIYTHRDHVGDPGGRLPYEPVPAAKQREALGFLSEHAFSEKAFRLSPSLLNKLAIEREPGLDFRAYFNQQRLDYPWHDAVLRLQRNLLDRLYDPITLGRILDNELRFGPKEKPFRMADLFDGLDGAIWSELSGGARRIGSLRRNLQREQLKHLIKLVLREQPPAGPRTAFSPPPPPPPPEDATTLARASLRRIQSKIRSRLVSKVPLERTTRAHLQETQGRIAAALTATMQKNSD